MSISGALRLVSERPAGVLAQQADISSYLRITFTEEALR